MKTKRTYIRPSVSVFEIVSPKHNLLSSMSIGADFGDFTDEGAIEDWTVIDGE